VEAGYDHWSCSFTLKLMAGSAREGVSDTAVGSLYVRLDRWLLAGVSVGIAKTIVVAAGLADGMRDRAAPGEADPVPLYTTDGVVVGGAIATCGVRAFGGSYRPSIPKEQLCHAGSSCLTCVGTTKVGFQSVG